MSRYNLKNIDPVNFLFLGLTPLIALGTTILWVMRDGFSWGQLGLGVIFYFCTGLSITAGYHRLFAHKAYDASPFVKLFFLIFGAASFQNSVLKWASDHRIHHQMVDSENDPYNINEGFFYAHMGWIFLKKNSDVNERYTRDLSSDKLVQWQHRYYIPIAVIVGIIFPTLLGGLCFGSYLGGFALGAMTRIVFTHHCTFFINSLCHCVGTTPYTDSNSARDSWFMAFLTFGEGYHNFHHYFQADYRNGVRWFQFDPTKWLINVLKWFGLAMKLRFTPEEKIIAARMQMKAKRLRREAGASAEKFLQELEKLKLQALDKYRRWQELNEQYRGAKAAHAAQRLSELKLKIRESRREFEALCEQWEFLVNHYGQVHILVKS